MASSRIFQILLRVAIQNQIGIAQRVIVDEIIQLRPLRHGYIQYILTPVQSMEIFLPSRSSSPTQPVSMLNLQMLSLYFMFVSLLPYGTLTVVCRAFL